MKMLRHSTVKKIFCQSTPGTVKYGTISGTLTYFLSADYCGVVGTQTPMDLEIGSRIYLFNFYG